MNKILIVDDEVDLRRALKAILESEGYTVEECIDGREAIEKVPHIKPDLILLDVMLPYINGLQVLEEIRAHKDCYSVFIILMTGVVPNLPKSEEKWDSILCKPFDMNSLLEAVASGLHAQQQNSKL